MSTRRLSSNVCQLLIYGIFMYLQAFVGAGLLWAGCTSCRQSNSVKALKEQISFLLVINSTVL